MNFDLFFNDFDILVGSMIHLLSEERDVEVKLTQNKRNIEERYRAEILPRYHVPVAPVVSHESTVQNVSQTFQETPIETPAEYSAEEPPMNEGTTESPEIAWSPDGVETSLLVKKLFKPIAIMCHPDKVADTKKHTFFLHGRKAYTENDPVTLLLILSKIPYTIDIDGDETKEIRMLIESRRLAMEQKKDSLFYKWSFIHEDDKRNILESIKPL